MMRKVCLSLISVGSLFASSVAFGVGGYTQIVIAHNLTGGNLNLNCKGGNTYRNKQTSITSDMSAIVMSASLQESKSTLLGGRYTCSYNYQGNRGSISFKLKSSQSVNVLTISEDSLERGMLNCTSERLNNLNRPRSIMRMLNNGGSHRGRRCH